MEKMEKVPYKRESLNLNTLFNTDYDDLFSETIKSRGITYYISDKVVNINSNNNITTAIVKGTQDYNVKVKKNKDNSLKVSCDCPYHKDTNIYCKHIYALLIAISESSNIDKLLNIYTNNINKIRDIDNSIKRLAEANKKYIEDGFVCSYYSWAIGLSKHYNSYIDNLEKLIQGKNYLKVKKAINDSYYYLNNIIDDYNKLTDYIENGKIEYNNKQNEPKKDDTITATYTIDDSGLFDALDDYIASMPLNVLEEARKQDIQEGKNTEIFDKAIKERKRRDELIRQEKERIEKQEREEQRRMKKAIRRSILDGIISGLLSSSNNSNKKDTSYLMPWEQEEVNKGNYEPYNFEEEELEEDDYYYEDDE